jgi:hypothetical protein
MTSYLFLRQLLEGRLDRRARQWFKEAGREIAEGASDPRFCSLLSLASRHTRGAALEPSEEEMERAGTIVEGLNVERWSLLDTLRAGLVLSRVDLAEESGALAIEEAFRYTDEGEAVALHRTLALLPEGERFLWRAGEGCRSNMRSVFEAAALDTPFPALHFDDDAFGQAAIKCLFVGAPLWRMWGLDDRLSDELARMALDLADERRSASRPVPHDLWLCLGSHGGERGRASLEQELSSSGTRQGQRAAVYALARSGDDAGATERLEILAASKDDPRIALTARNALAGNTSSEAFRDLDPNL